MMKRCLSALKAAFCCLLLFSSVMAISCTSQATDDGTDAVASRNGPYLSISLNRPGRFAGTERSVFGSQNMYSVSVTLTGTNYSETNSVEIPVGSNSTIISFMDVPIGSVTATATVYNRYHKKWTGSESTILSAGEESNMEISLTEEGFDLSGMATGDIVLSTGGYITRSDYKMDIDQEMGTRYAALKIGSQFYAIKQGMNQYSSTTYSQCVSSAASAGGISWASETSFRLPTKEELQAVYDQRDSWMGIYSSDGAAFGLATTFTYWTSTSSGSTSYYCLHWYTGDWDDTITNAGDEYICKLN